MTTNGAVQQSTLSRLMQRVHEVGKFGVVGAAAFVVDFAILNFLHFGVGIGLITAKTISTLVAMTIAYFGNRLWTWRDRRRVGFRREYAMFGAINFVGLAIQDAVLWFAANVLDQRDPIAVNIGNVVGVAVATFFRFWAYRKWVFPHEPSDQPADPLETTTLTPY